MTPNIPIQLKPYFLTTPEEQLNRVGRRLRARYFRTKNRVVKWSRRSNGKKHKIITYELRTS